jgi:catechol 2,3-dioxygenase-like lactoylglutathione lyase family enzyme
MIRLSKLGHVNLRVADVERSRWFYTEVLGFKIAEEDPQHGGVFTTLGGNFHSLDFSQHPDPASAQRPVRGQVGLIHIAFQVDSHAALRDAYLHLLEHGVEIDHATNHLNQRSLYFSDPDDNGLEIYYELPFALQLFPDGRGDEDDALPVSRPGEPLPGWLFEDWPGPEMRARIDAIRERQEAGSGQPVLS